MPRPSAKLIAKERKQIGARLRARRLQLNITQRQVADALKIEPASVSGWERGTASPSLNHQTKLANLLDVSLEWILTGQDAQKAPLAVPAPSKQRAGAHRASVSHMSDIGVEVLGEMAQRIERLYQREGFALSVRDAVILAYGFVEQSGPFKSARDAEAAMKQEQQRLKRFLQTLPKRARR